MWEKLKDIIAWIIILTPFIALLFVLLKLLMISPIPAMLFGGVFVFVWALVWAVDRINKENLKQMLRKR